MGDRTYVILQVLRDHEDAVGDIIEKSGWKADEGYPQPADPHRFYLFGFEDVNYGELGFLPDLEEKGIPYDSSWASGDEYGEGTRSCRFDSEGNKIVKELYDADAGIPLFKLMELLHDFTALATAIREKRDALYVLPWDEQIHNGKLFLTHQLINPTQE